MNLTRSYLHYNTFSVGTESEEYPLTIGGFTGITPTDPFVQLMDKDSVQLIMIMINAGPTVQPYLIVDGGTITASTSA